MATPAPVALVFCLLASASLPAADNEGKSEGKSPVHWQLGPGVAAGFPAGKADGHQLVNETKKPVLYLEIGDRTPGDGATYSEADLAAKLVDGKWVFTHKDGSPYM